MTPAQTAMIGALAGTLDAKAILTDAADIEPWLIDWRRRFHGAAPAILSPTSTDQVAAIMQAASAHRVPLVAQGGNSSMVGGATPPGDGEALILSLRRMNRIRRLDAEANLAVCEAGVILADLHAAAIEAGRRFPLSLGAKGNASIGGLVSTNAGGTQVLRFGSMRGLVAGVEAVLTNGEVYDGLAALKKDNRGYDLDQLLIGAEGTLAIVTAATLRLVALPPATVTAWAATDDPEHALRLLRRLQTATDATESFEILPAETLAAALAYLPDVRPPVAGRQRWHLLIEVTDADTALLERVLAAALDDGLIGDATIAASEAQAHSFWRLRESLSDAERATGPATQHDLSVPVEAMPRFMVEAAAACDARFPGTRASGFGHLGDGNIHFHVRGPRDANRERWLADHAAAITHFVDDLVTAAGGSIAAEHGIGQMKIDELARLASPAKLTAMRAIKAAMDPLGLLNPGKLVALASPPANQ
ncbi:FAD/FMN-containing dehydrogenase [Sphingomonas jinjuensis]|uniref:FAD/FMN-containing dehydrogenase n=1 Tax=Sphingomonas jinjuensis TaxID=535907 RepID=A0A840FDQ7_9SPHN|nr:FAD-binding oxidoreductase [Sphingomonas jinjuensis]MBB4153707.1 FAD/FMN-containing dehydrogenase [Sphingomonas jinjuensis]